jgi:hypothetical protein
MKVIAVLLLSALSVPVLAEKMTVKVINHHVGQNEYTNFVPAMTLGNGNATANCGSYGNNVNCAGSSSGTTIYAPSHTIQGYLTVIVMTLLLPDGRKVDVGCQDHFWGLTKANRHNCKNPTVDDLEANFSGDKVKLTWVAGIDGKKKDSETFIILKVFPASTSSVKP